MEPKQQSQIHQQPNPDLPVSEAPKDPLKQIQKTQLPNTTAFKPAQQPILVNQYSYSDLKKGKRRRSSLLFKSTFVLILFLAVGSAALLGFQFYNQVSTSPNQRFESMISAILTRQNVAYSVQSSSDSGVISARYQLQTSEGRLNTEGNVAINAINGDVAVSARVNVASTDDSYTVQNIESLSIRRGEQDITSSQRALVTNKWVRVPGGVNYSEENAVVQFLEAGSNFVGPVGLPIGFKDIDANQLLNAYSYTCEDVRTGIVRCDVAVDSTLYNQAAGLQPSVIDNFAVFIDTNTDLPLEINHSVDGQNTEIAYSFTNDDLNTLEPAGPLDIDTYKNLTNEFVNSLR